MRKKSYEKQEEKEKEKGKHEIKTRRIRRLTSIEILKTEKKNNHGIILTAFISNNPLPPLAPSFEHSLKIV